MNRRGLNGTGAALGLLSLLATAQPAAAQGRLPRTGGQLPPGGYLREVQPQFRNYGEWALYQEFRGMRATAPRPNTFLGGRYNPQYEVAFPPGYGTAYPGYGYPGYNYLYFGTPLGGFGYGGPSVIQQRDVLIIKEGSQNPQAQAQTQAGTGNAATTGRGGATAPAPATPPPATEKTDAPKPAPGADFYLKPQPAGETLLDALDDIRKAWLNGDLTRLESRFNMATKVRVYPAGQYRYSLESKEFVALLKDAMKRIDTTAFEFDRPSSETAGTAFVTGQHTFMDPQKQKQVVHVSYSLTRDQDGKWKIGAAGSAPSPITRHID